MLYYTILYYTILYYTILYYTILYYTILYYTLFHYNNITYVTCEDAGLLEWRCLSADQLRGWTGLVMGALYGQ